MEIPKKFTCDGLDVSPAPTLNDPPSGTVAFALVADDPDAPGGTWIHWVIYDLPAATRELPAGLPHEDQLPNAARQGRNDFKRVGHNGPCPPMVGGQHRMDERKRAEPVWVMQMNKTDKDKRTSCAAEHVCSKHSHKQLA